MTQLYNGNDNYELHLSSGKIVELSLDEINEISSDFHVNGNEFQLILDSGRTIILSDNDIDSIVSNYVC